MDGKLYTGLTRRDVDERASEHQQGLSAFTKMRRPVELIFSEQYLQITDAIAAERRIKGWSRAKKLAYVAGDFERLSALARRKRLQLASPRGSRRGCAAPHHEGTEPEK